MKFDVMSLGPYGANCTVACDSCGNAIAIDPGAEAQRVLGALARLGANLSMIFLTHGHFDHISAVNALLERHSVPVLLGEGDGDLVYSQFNKVSPLYVGMRETEHLRLYGPDERIAGFEEEIRIIPTPGHSEGSASLYFPESGVLVAGDTLFRGSVGRTDFPGGSYRKLLSSLRILSALPGNTRVIAGHGEDTTIGEEIASNPYMRDLFV